MTNTPPSFDLYFASDWGISVLQNGLPPIPSRLTDSDSIPIALWKTQDLGAVLFVGYHTNEDLGTGSGQNFDCEILIYAPTKSHGWGGSDTSGGGSWPSDDPLNMAPPVGSDDEYVIVNNLYVADFDAHAVAGSVSKAVKSISITGASGSSSRGVPNLTLGVFVAAWYAREPISLAFLDSQDIVLGSREFGVPML